MANSLEFCGYEWVIRVAQEPQGPGPNRFSVENAFVVGENLHLVIQPKDGIWYCGEVILPQTLGYGRYSITVLSDISNLDCNVVFGFFVWSDNPAYAHREIDVEISKWGKQDLPNGQFVIQPYDQPNRLVRFVVPGKRANRFSFLWKPRSVVSQAEQGMTEVYHKFVTGVPPTRDETTRINLWLYRGIPPFDDQPIEVVVKEFTFTPYRPLRDKMVTSGRQIWQSILDLFRGLG